jgi:Kdo2-lipid IVA lauroyltransferase/acyltransferase
MTRRRERGSSWLADLAARVAITLLQAIQRLPFVFQVHLGRGLGALLHTFGRGRRAVALRNLELCMPALSRREHQRIVREHFALLGRTIVERGTLWFAEVERLKGLIHVEGDVALAERSERPVMWLVPHFVGLEVAGAAVQLFQSRLAVDIYRRQSNLVLDDAIKRGRLRFGRAEAFARQEGIRPVIKRIREGAAFFNMPDQDFGAKDAAFVPFFGVSAATLLAPARLAKTLDMIVQPVVVHLLPGGAGWRVEFKPPLQDWPGDDAVAATARMNAMIEAEVLGDPAQYLWVHQRFKTRPEGEAGLY